jgi:hypothetical protein
MGQREGLCFETPHSHSARELVYRSLEAADQAEVKRHALIIYGLFSPNSIGLSRPRTAGRALMPERLIAITKGDAAAVPLPKARPGSFEGTSKPMIVTPPM